MHAAWRMLALGLSLLVMLAGTANAQITPEQQQQVVELTKKIGEAQAAMRGRQYEAAGKAVVEAEALLTELDAGIKNPLAKRYLARYAGTLEGLRRNVERQNVKLPAAPGMAPAAKPGQPANPNTPAPVGDAVVFSKDVLPMLTSKCGTCHMGNANRGNFNMNTFSALMSGAGGIRVIDPKDGKSSRIVEVIASGDMPRGGGRVSKDELDKLIAWIDAGAKFDGTDPAAPLRQLAAAANAPANTPRVEVMESTGRETVKFSRDIAPILTQNCTACHGADDASADLSLASFTRMLRGGDSGPILVPGKGAQSLLVQKLKGTAGGQRMPLRRPALPDDVIAKVETWINEGATFDAGNPDMATQAVAAIAMAEAMTHDELAQHRLGLAEKNWNLANPRAEYKTFQTDHFLLLGNVRQSRLEEVAQLAEEQHEKVAKLFGQPADKPLIKGKLTLYLFDQYFEYGEFGMMVEKRELPRDWRGHFGYSIVDAYAALAPPREEKDTFTRTLAEQIAGAYLESLGNVPQWFSQGVARAASAKLDPKSPAVADWDERLPAVLSRAKPDTLLKGGAGLSDSAVVYYGFGKGLISKMGTFNNLVANMKKGAPFEQAFQAAYGSTPEQLVARWAGGSRR